MSIAPVCGTPRRLRCPSLVRLFSDSTLTSKSHQLGVGLYLTDLTFCREGNPSHRTSPKAPEKKLINFNKYHKLARIVQGASSTLFVLQTWPSYRTWM